MNGDEIIAVPGNEGQEEDIIMMAEQRVNQLQRILETSLKVTNSQDWIDQQGKPYLMGSGAEKIARLFGLRIKDVKSDKRNSQDEKGSFYFYVYTGVVEMGTGKDSIEAVGTCSSKDQFFAKKGGVLKPLSEIDETNIMKAAYTNMVVNGITRLLGLRNLTWEQLQKAGLNTDKIVKVNYQKGAEGGGGNSDSLSQAQSGKIHIMIKDLGWDDKQYHEYIKKYFNVEHSTQLTKSQASKLIERLVEIQGEGK